MSKILITGGLGVVGSNLSSIYLDQGNDVSILDVANQPRHDFILNQIKNKYLNVDFRKEKLEESKLEDIEDFDYIVHCAASTSIPGSVIDPITDYNSNSLATFNLLEKLRLANKKIPTLIFSSVKPYQVDQYKIKKEKTRYVWDEDIGGISETNPLSPKEPYAANKLAQSTLSRSYAICYDLPITTIRFSNLYASNAYPKNMHGWLTSFCIKAALNREIVIEGTGLQVRDMLHYRDIYEAVEAVRMNTEKTQKQIFNVGGGFDNSISVLEATNLLKEISSKELNVKYGKGRDNEDPIFITDYLKFKQATGWYPRVSVKDGVKEIYNWALKNKDNLERIK